MAERGVSTVELAHIVIKINFVSNLGIAYLDN